MRRDRSDHSAANRHGWRTGRGGTNACHAKRTASRSTRLRPLLDLLEDRTLLAAPIIDLNGVATGSDFSTIFTENQAPLNIAATDATLTDADSDVASMTVTLAASPDGALESLAIDSAILTAQNIALDPASNATTLILLGLSGSQPAANFQAALRQITYSNTSDDPTTSVRTVTVIANDGKDNSNTATTTISIIAVNDPPTATNLIQTRPYIEDDASVALDDIVITDPDTGDVITATLTLANTATGLLTTGSFGVTTSTYNPATGIWTATGTVADVNSALAAVAFIPAANNNLDTTISTRIRDAANSGPAIGTITLDVTPVNDPPSAVSAAIAAVAGQSASITLAGSDEETPLGSLVFTILTLPVGGDLFTTGGTKVDVGNNFSGSPSALIYLADSSFTGADSFTYLVRDTGDPAGTPANALNSAPATITLNVTARADLQIAISDNPDPVSVGAQLTYTLTVTNNGPSDSTGVSVVNTLPANVDFVSATGGVTPNAGVLNFNIGTLAAGSSTVLTILVQPTGAAVVSITNTASVIGSQADPIPSNNTAIATTGINQVVNLALTITDSPDPISVGGLLTYTVTISNLGLSAANNVVLTNTLPANVTFVSATGGVTPVAGVLTFNLSILAAGNSSTVDIQVRPTAAAAGTITNTASATSSQTTPITTSETTNVAAVANLAVAIADDPDPVPVEADLTYTITVTNNGPSPATGVMLVHTLPANIVFVSATGGVLPVSGTLTFNLGSIASGVFRTLTILVRPTLAAAATTLTSTAQLSATELDPDPSNNSATETTQVVFTLVVTNNSDDDVQGSLRRAIRLANENPNQNGQPDAIVFELDPTERIITLTSLLPAVDESLVISGRADYAVVLNAACIVPDVLVINAGLSAVRGLSIVNYTRHGIVLQGNQGGSLIAGNRIGESSTGIPLLCQGEVGVFINRSPNNTIGGAAASDSNVIVRNTIAGIQITGGAIGNQIQGNFIGTNPTRQGGIGNAVGVLVENGGLTTIGGSVLTTGSGVGNVISGNTQAGISLGTDASSILILGNLIGVVRGNANQILALPNGGAVAGPGVLIAGATGSTLGGPTLGDHNIISGNAGAGVEITAGSGNQVAGNLIGTDDKDSLTISNGASGVHIRGASSSLNTIGGGTTGARNIVSGNRGHGIEISEGASQNVVAGNYIGTDLAGAVPLPNGTSGNQSTGNGVMLASALSNLIGGTTANTRNVISGNRLNGIAITGASSSNSVQGNWIGLDASGGTILPNGTNGILIHGTGNTIGGTAAAARNVISGNVAHGVEITQQATGTHLQGNSIGLNAAGNESRGNSLDGVFVDNAANVTIDTNAISGNSLYGVRIEGALSSSTTLVRNLIGTDATGALDLGNMLGGLLVQNTPSITIGAADSGNVISGNGNPGSTIHGVTILNSNSTTLVGNSIGTNLTGTAAIPNTGDGINISDSLSVSVSANLISGNGHHGFSATGANDLRITGNRIGVGSFTSDIDGNIALGNGSIGGGDGIHLSDTKSATIGGMTPADRNIISNNRRQGIYVESTVSALTISGNYIGTNAQGTAARGNSQGGILLDGATLITIGGSTTGAGNLISGNGGPGIEIAGSLARLNLIAGNRIGTDANGATALGNSTAGVLVTNAANNTIGTAKLNSGNTIGTANLISGNRGEGVQITGLGSTNNLIAGNFIGTNSLGTARLGNTARGVFIDGSPKNTIGGVDTTLRNIISANNADGVYLSGTEASKNLILGNYICTNVDGRASLGNRGQGVHIENAPENTVGGDQPGEGNLISGNEGDGVRITGADTTSTLVAGNRIGTDFNVTSALANSGSGVSVQDQATNTTIGGPTTTPGLAPGNIISGNRAGGVRIARASNVIVAGNLIGTEGNGIEPIANSAGGVSLIEASGNIIGGSPSQANIISGNQGDGVLIGKESSGNRVASNFIGTTQTGMSPLGNTGRGVFLDSASTNTIGGTSPGAGNVISANTGDGIQINGMGATQNSMIGNFIGTNQNRTDLGNTGNGVNLTGKANANTIALNHINSNAVGIRLADQGTNFNEIYNNSVNNNDGDGILISSHASAQVLYRNVISSNNGSGLVILNAPSNLISLGNILYNNRLHGIQIAGADSKENQVFGTQVTNNTLFGIFIANASGNRIGYDFHNDNDALDRTLGNTISKNRSHGIEILGTSATQAENNHIQGNTITENNGIGVFIVNAGSNHVYSNTIAKNAERGIEITSTDPANPNFGARNTVTSNLIDANRSQGVRLVAASSTLIRLNTIASSKLEGLQLFSAPSNTIQENTISSNELDGIAIIQSPTNTIAGNLIDKNMNDAIELFGASTTGNRLTGNWLVNSSLAGLRIVSAPGNYIGERYSPPGPLDPTTTPGAGNLISGNTTSGIQITGDSANTIIKGNRIGTDSTGTAKMPNATGILLTDTAQIAIGGPYAGDRNIISGNSLVGVQITGKGSKDNVLQNNFIGLGLDGNIKEALGNGPGTESQNLTDDIGVWILEAPGNTIGPNNVISGNAFAGIQLQGREATGNRVIGNLIGTDSSERSVYQIDSGNRQGEDRRLADFETSSNQFYGIMLNATIRNIIGQNGNLNLIAGNDVGIGVIGDTSNGGNSDSNNKISYNNIRDNEIGIFIDGSQDTSISTNDISRNLAIGIAIRGEQAINNSIQGNTISQNQGQTFFGTGNRDEPVGTGIYIEGARNNIIGPTRNRRATTGQSNQISSNSLAGVYFFNNATGNRVQGNTIDPDGGDYGILLFNSARNLSTAARRDNTIRNNARVARYREFTGSPVQLLVPLPELPQTPEDNNPIPAPSAAPAHGKAAATSVDTTAKHPVGPRPLMTRAILERRLSLSRIR